jgi:hypothetical protein
MGWNGQGRKKDSGGLGYRELDCFNLALLAGDSGLQQPESQAAKVIQDKYYPEDCFLNSNLGRRPSYAWSIWQAKPLL